MARIVTRKEAEGRRFRLRVFAGMFDFLATIGSLILIFACGGCGNGCGNSCGCNNNCGCNTGCGC